MNYVKQNFKSGQVLKADHLNHMEAGIVKLEQDISKLPGGETASLTIGTVTSGETASASIDNGKLNLVLPRGAQGQQGERGLQGETGPQGPTGATGATGAAGPAGANGKDGAAGAKGDKGDKGDTGPAGPGFSDSAKGLILSLFEGAAYGNDAMQAKLTALKAEWNAGTEEPDTPSDTEDIPGETPVYKLAQATEFTPAKAQCIDTGIKMLSSIDPKPGYTILFEVQYNESLAAQKDTYALLHCMEESSPWPGFVVQVGSNGMLQYNMYGCQKMIDTRTDLIANKRKFAIQFYDSRIRGISYNGNYLSGDKDKDYATDITGYTTAVNKSLIIGARQQSNGTKDRYFDGTLYQCLVYDKALTPAQMLAWINS